MARWYMTSDPCWCVRRKVTGCFGWGSVRRTAVCCWHHQEARPCTCLLPTRSCAPWDALPEVSGYAICHSSLTPPPQCHTASHPTTHSLVNSRTASLHVMQSLDRLPPVEAFRFLVQESGYGLTTHILHGTFCQCSISACWHQERHCHACVCRPWHSQRMRP